jgi:hypothetical protein
MNIILPSLPPNYIIITPPEKSPHSLTITRDLTIYQTSGGTFEFLHNVLEAMERLYEWALSLPDFKDHKNTPQQNETFLKNADI